LGEVLVRNRPSHDFGRELGRLLRGEVNALANELRLRRRDGTMLDIQSTVTLVEDAQDRPGYFLEVLEDISNRKEVERQGAEAQRLEAIGLLAGGIAHDLNNLLTPIIGYTEMALEAEQRGQPVAPDLEPVLAAAERARDLVKQLLAFGRQQPLEVGRVDVAQLLDGMRSLLRPLMPESIALEVVANGDGHVIAADPVQIQQALMNLAVNAIDAMPLGGTLHVEVGSQDATARDGACASDRYVCIEVRDTGKGIEPAVLPRVFEPFFTTKAPGQGIGLGLAMAYGIVRQHEGEIRVRSELGRGTSFTILIPRAERPVGGEPAAIAVDPSSPASTRVGTLVLVAEDEAAVRALIRRVLAGSGYSVLDAGTGEGALELAMAHPRSVDLLVTDVIMPGMSGVDLYNHLSERGPPLGVLFLSGYAHYELTSRRILAAEEAFLQKPFAPTELLRKVEEVLKRR